MSEESFEDFEKAINEISKKLDQIDMELSMSSEALETISINLMLLETELDFEAERNKDDYWT